MIQFPSNFRGWLETLLVLLVDHEGMPQGEEVGLHGGLRGRLWRGEDVEKGLVLLLHGYGGDWTSSYVLSAADLLHKSGLSVLALDAPGVGRSRGTEDFWGGGFSDQGMGDGILDLIDGLDFVPRKIWAVGFSAGGGWLLSWLCRSPRAAALLEESFFVSPTIRHKEMLRHVRRNLSWTIRNYLSVKHTTALLQHRIHHGKWNEIPHILWNCTFDVLYANVYGTGRSKTIYVHPKIEKKLKGLAILSEDDPITPFFLMKDFEEYCETIVFKHGGHCGFFDADGSRLHEKIILERILNNLK